MGASQVKGVEQRAQSQDSRDEILKAAMHLFASRGFHETSMSEVAREAHVSKALIFWHFKTKEELFVAVLNRLLEPYVIDFAEEAGALDERAQLKKLVEFYLSFVRENVSSVRFFLAQMLHDPHLSESLNEQVLRLYGGYRALLTELIARSQQNGICKRRFAPEAATGFFALCAQWVADRVSVHGRQGGGYGRCGGDGGGVAVRRLGAVVAGAGGPPA